MLYWLANINCTVTKKVKKRGAFISLIEGFRELPCVAGEVKNMAEVVDDPIFRNKNHVFDDRLHAGELLSEKLEEYGARSMLMSLPFRRVECR